MGIKEQKKELPYEYKRVLSLIPEGSHKPIRVADIRRLTGYSDVLVRDIVSKLIVSYHFPIGTSNARGRSGYYWITNPDERKDAVKNLKSRAYKILLRADTLENMPDKEQDKFDL